MNRRMHELTSECGRRAERKKERKKDERKKEYTRQVLSWLDTVDVFKNYTFLFLLQIVIIFK